MLRDNRVLFFHTASFLDFTSVVSNVHSGTQIMDFDTATDYLYLGSDFPFNHRYFDISVANGVAASLSIDVWTGSQWAPVVDIMDETAVNGVPLAQSGVISWQIDKDMSSWSSDDTDLMDSSGLETAPKIYGLYWMRMKYDQNLTGTMAFNYIGHRFSYDEALVDQYPLFARTNLKTAWKSGKTDWKEQTLMAAEYIIERLRGTKDIIKSASQILDWKRFEKASIHKTAEIIFQGLGQDYEDQLAEAHKSFQQSMNLGKFNVDQNKNATLDPVEKETNSRYSSR